MCEAVTADEENELFKEIDLDKKYRNPKRKIKEKLRAKFLMQDKCTGQWWLNLLKAKLPILDWLPKYNCRESMLGDVTAGLTVGIVHIPQGLAYSQLASLPPVVGLYVSLFPVLLYPFFGTSRHVSMGTFAIVSIIVSSVLTKHVPLDYCENTAASSAISQHIESNNVSTAIPAFASTNSSSSHIDCNEIYNSRMIEVATALALSVGLVQILMHVFKLGIISVFLSQSMLSGFLSGAAFMVVTSQIPRLFGLAIVRQSPPFGVVKIYIALFRNIGDTNVATLIISVICITFLMLGKEINQRYKKTLPIPIPWELFVVAIATACSYFMKLNESYHVADVGLIPSGIFLSIPKGNDVIAVFIDAIPIAATAFVLEITQCQMFATKHSYDIDSNQELLALGMCNVFGSFFCCYPSGPSLSRSVIYEEVGAKTQMGSYVSSVVVTIVLLWVGPLFQTLPQTILACIIIVNIRSIVLLLKNVKSLWKISRLDGFTMIVTWLSVVSWNVVMGLAIGIVFSIFTVLLRARNANGLSLKKILPHGVYRNSDKYSTMPNNNDKIFIYQFTRPLFFGNKDVFNKKLIRHLGYDPVKLSACINASDEKLRSATTVDFHDEPNELDSKLNHTSASLVEIYTSEIPVSTASDGLPNTPVISSHLVVIFDMTRCSFVDSDGGKCLRVICEALQKLDKTVMITSCSDDVKTCLDSCWADAYEINFISLESAVTYAQMLLRKRDGSDCNTG